MSSSNALAYDLMQELAQPTVKMACQDVHVHYGDAHALKGVSLDVHAREVLALIGPSGCGKSTFLRCLNRMNETIIGAKVTGQITIDGQDIYDPS